MSEAEKDPKQVAAINNGNMSITKGPDKKGYWHKGLTKREHFAALAMQQIIDAHRDGETVMSAERAVRYADALLLALEEQP